MSVSGPAGTTELVHSASTRAEQVRVGSAGERAQVRVYDRRGRLLESAADQRRGGGHLAIRRARRRRHPMSNPRRRLRAGRLWHDGRVSVSADRAGVRRLPAVRLHRRPEPDAYAEAIEAARKAIEDGDCIVLPDRHRLRHRRGRVQPGRRAADCWTPSSRGRDMPPPVLIAESSLIRALATDVPQEAKDLVAEHWPGPLTVICQIQPSLRMDLGDSKDTIALRVPDHPLTREILRRTGPMAVSSANLSGQPAALTCDEAIDQLGDSVAVYLDGGALAAHDGAAVDDRRLHPARRRRGAAARRAQRGGSCARPCPTCDARPRPTRRGRGGRRPRHRGPEPTSQTRRAQGRPERLSARVPAGDDRRRSR